MTFLSFPCGCAWGRSCGEAAENPQVDVSPPCSLVPPRRSAHRRRGCAVSPGGGCGCALLLPGAGAAGRTPRALLPSRQLPSQPHLPRFPSAFVQFQKIGHWLFVLEEVLRVTLQEAGQHGPGAHALVKGALIAASGSRTAPRTGHPSLAQGFFGALLCFSVFEEEACFLFSLPSYLHLSHFSLLFRFAGVN